MSCSVFDVCLVPFSGLAMAAILGGVQVRGSDLAVMSCSTGLGAGVEAVPGGVKIRGWFIWHLIETYAVNMLLGSCVFSVDFTSVVGASVKFLYHATFNVHAMQFGTDAILWHVVAGMVESSAWLHD